MFRVRNGDYVFGSVCDDESGVPARRSSAGWRLDVVGGDTRCVRSAMRSASWSSICRVEVVAPPYRRCLRYVHRASAGSRSGTCPVVAHVACLLSPPRPRPAVCCVRSRQAPSRSRIGLLRSEPPTRTDRERTPRGVGSSLRRPRRFVRSAEHSVVPRRGAASTDPRQHGHLVRSGRTAAGMMW